MGRFAIGFLAGLSSVAVGVAAACIEIIPFI